MSEVFHGVVRDGKLVWQDPQGIIAHMKPLEGQHVVVTVSPARSTDANNFYWALVDETARVTGNAPRGKFGVHDTWKRMFLVPDSKGRYTTRNLSRQRFADYVDHCTVSALEYGVDLEHLGRLAAAA